MRRCYFEFFLKIGLKQYYFDKINIINWVSQIKLYQLNIFFHIIKKTWPNLQATN